MPFNRIPVCLQFNPIAEQLGNESEKMAANVGKKKKQRNVRFTGAVSLGKCGVKLLLVSIFFLFETWVSYSCHQCFCSMLRMHKRWRLVFLDRDVWNFRIYTYIYRHHCLCLSLILFFAHAYFPLVSKVPEDRLAGPGENINIETIDPLLNITSN